MSKGKRERPKRLAKKLRQIRIGLGLSQNEMIQELGRTGKITQDYISAYERGIREPPLPILLKYARMAGTCLDVLVDDQLELPKKIPRVAKHS